MKTTFALLFALAATVQTAAAQEVFAGKGIFGEASFSDQQLAGHTAIRVETTPADRDTAAVRARTLEIAALADELEQARKTREQARVADRPVQTEPTVVESYVPPQRTYFPDRYHHQPWRYPQKTPVIQEPPQLPPRKTFEPAFRPIRSTTR